LSPATLQAIFGPAEEPRLGTLDRVMNTEAAYGLGFQKPDRAGGWFSPSPGAVGFLGASGALAFADPDNRIAMACRWRRALA
jgi:CubicO group peptidase (beta-lactamase class C family)